MAPGGFEVVKKRGEAGPVPFNEARGPRPARGAEISSRGGFRGEYRGGYNQHRGGDRPPYGGAPASTEQE